MSMPVTGRSLNRKAVPVSQCETPKSSTGPFVVKGWETPLDPKLFSDLTLVARSQHDEDDSLTIACHRHILATYSPVFRAMLTLEMKESREKVVNLKEESASALGAMVHWMYGEDMAWSLEEVMDVSKVAAKYQVAKLLEGCIHILCDQVRGNAGRSYQLSRTYLQSQELEHKCVLEVTAWLEDKDTRPLDLWQDIPYELMVQVLQQDSLPCSSEYSVWRAAVLWMLVAKPSPCEAELVIRQVRYELMTKAHAGLILKYYDQVSSTANLLTEGLVARLLGEGYLKQVRGLAHPRVFTKLGFKF